MSGSHRVPSRLPRVLVALLATLGVLAVAGGVVAGAGWLGTGDEPRRTGGPASAGPETSSSASRSADPAVIAALDGFGDDDVVLSDQRMTPGTPLLFSAVHSGSGVFAVTALDAQGQTQEVLVASEGAYDGSSVVYADEPLAGKRLEVRADGAWTLTVKELTAAPDLDSDGTGDGDEVLVYRGSGGVATFTQQAEADFAVYGDADAVPNLLFIGVGTFAGTAKVEPGPTVIEIDAAGPWTLTVD